MSNRATRLGKANNYFSAKSGIEKKKDDFTYAWLEVAHNPNSNSVDYVVHASNDAALVPPFAIEHYKDGKLQGYEVSKEIVDKNAMMSEETREKIVRSQIASQAVAEMSIRSFPSPSMK